MLDETLSLCRSHSTSAGFAISYLGANFRPITELPSGILFKAKFGKHRNVQIVIDSEKFELHPSAARVLSADLLPSIMITPVKRKEYVLSSLDISHLDKKSRYNETKHPPKAMEKQGFVFRRLEPDDFSAVELLWEKWCKTKLENPKVHRISFTAARYLRCVKDCLQNLYESRAYVLINQESRVASCRVLQTTPSRAFDLAFFSDFEIKESSRAMQWLSLNDLLVGPDALQEVNFG